MKDQKTRLSDIPLFTICKSKTKDFKRYILLYKDEEDIIYYMEDERGNLVQQSKNDNYPQNAAVTIFESPDGNYRTLCDVRYGKEEYEEFRKEAIRYLLAYNQSIKKDKPKQKRIAQLTTEDYVKEISFDNENDIHRFNPLINHATPEVKKLLVNKIERGAIAQKIKALYEYKCKVCEALRQNPYTFRKPNNKYYIETHHIVLVSKLQPGSLASSNLITLCANHHRQMHYGNVEILKNTPDVFHLILDEREIKIVKINLDNLKSTR